MKIEINIEKKHILVLVVAICITSAIPLIVASPARPGVSHSADEVAPGSFQTGTYTFPGSLTVGGVLDMVSHKIINLASPTADTDAATKGYVDAASGTLVCEAGPTASCTTGLGGACAAYGGDCPAGYTQVGTSKCYISLSSCWISVTTPERCGCTCPDGFSGYCYHAKHCCKVQ